MSYLLNYIFNDFNPNLNIYSQAEEQSNCISTNYRFTELENNKYLIEISLPGHDKNSIEVSYTNKSLLVKTKIQKESLPQFYKDFLLDKNIKVSNANIKNGLLRITLTKNIPDEDKPKLITIN